MIAYIGLGSNLGDRLGLLRRALGEISDLPGVKILKVSSVYETAPYGPVRQRNFYNACAEISCRRAGEVGAAWLHRNLHRIEKKLGRKRTVRWGPRSIDLDLLLFGDLSLPAKGKAEKMERENENGLFLPHPEIPKRRFVLAPLAEIHPHLRHPSWRGDVRLLLRRAPPLKIRRLGPLSP